jgi:hypothetical protein
MGLVILILGKPAEARPFRTKLLKKQAQWPGRDQRTEEGALGSSAARQVNCQQVARARGGCGGGEGISAGAASTDEWEEFSQASGLALPECFATRG